MSTEINKPVLRKPSASANPVPEAARDCWELRLYVADDRPSSALAFARLKTFCEGHLTSRYRIKVIDVLKHPAIAKRDQIVAIPTLVRRNPLPVRRMIGDLADTGRTMVGLDLLPTSGMQVK